MQDCAEAGVQFLPAEVVDVVARADGTDAEVHCEDGTVVKCRCVLHMWGMEFHGHYCNGTYCSDGSWVLDCSSSAASLTAPQGIPAELTQPCTAVQQPA